MNQIDPSRSNANLTTATYHNHSQSFGPSYGGTAAQSPSVGLDETAALQAEIDALDRERQSLLLKQERLAKRAELDRLRRYENVNTMATEPSIHVPPSVSLPSPAPSYDALDQKSEKKTDSKTRGLDTPQEQMPPQYSPTLDRTPYNSQYLSPTSFQQSTQSTRLAKPIAIPATSTKLGSPFMRAYPPSLTTYGVDRAEFLGFLDDLNRCAVASPPVQILGLAGNIVSFVPLQTAQIVGASVNFAATVATVGVSKGRTEHCLRAANRALFAPRGLKVEIAKLSALAKLAGMPGVLDPATGKVDKRASLLAPIESLEAAQSQSAQHRRMQALESWIAPLDLEPLPEIKQSSNALGKLHTMASENQRKKEEKKILKDRKKAYGEGGKALREVEKVEKEFEKEMQKLDKEERKVRRKEADDSGKLEKELVKIDKERNKVTKEREKEMIKVEEDKRKEDKEEEGLRKILWLIIRNVEDSSGPGPNPDLESPDLSPVHSMEFQ